MQKISIFCTSPLWDFLWEPDFFGFFAKVVLSEFFRLRNLVWGVAIHSHRELIFEKEKLSLFPDFCLALKCITHYRKNGLWDWKSKIFDFSYYCFGWLKSSLTRLRWLKTSFYLCFDELLSFDERMIISGFSKIWSKPRLFCGLFDSRYLVEFIQSNIGCSFFKTFLL